MYFCREIGQNMLVSDNISVPKQAQAKHDCDSYYFEKGESSAGDAGEICAFTITSKIHRIK